MILLTSQTVNHNLAERQLYGLGHITIAVRLPSSVRHLARDRKIELLLAHAYGAPRSGPFNGSIVNPDTGRPVMTDDDQLRRADFRKTRHSELVLSEEQSNPLKARRTMFSALWQADGSKVRRCAPMDLIGRYEPAEHTVRQSRSHGIIIENVCHAGTARGVASLFRFGSEAARRRRNSFRLSSRDVAVECGVPG